MMRRRGISIAGPVVVVLLLLASAAIAQPAEVSSRPLPNAPIDDRCSQVSGYPAFRQSLEQAAKRRDSRAFQALFSDQGGMRVLGVGGPTRSSDWSPSEAARVWPELDKILGLGCAVDGDRLYLPAMAVLIDHPDVEPGYVAALSNLVVSARPRQSQADLRLVKQGQLMLVVKHGEPKGWIEVLLDGRPAYVRSNDVRSPHDFELTLIREKGQWRIWEFVSGI